MYVKREGVAAKAGHDLVLEVTRWTATATVDSHDLQSSKVNASFDARSLDIKEATGGAMPLSDKDRADIKKTIAEKVLLTDRHPEITFASNTMETTGSDTVTLAGDLRIVGVSRPTRFPLAVHPADGGVRVTGAVSLVQSDWNIKPFRGMMGLLKVRDEIEVRVDVMMRPA